MDPIFGGVMRPSRRSSSKKDDRKQILYMPDWRPDISAAPVMKDVLESLCDARGGSLDVILRPHPVTLQNQPGWVEGWVDLSASCPNLTVHVTAGVDHLSLMADADLVIADFSSSAFTFLAFDAPLVLVRPRSDVLERYRMTERHAAILEGVAECVDEGEEVVERVLHALEGPVNGDETRARMRAGVFGGGADGRAAVRTVTALRDFLDR